MCSLAMGSVSCSVCVNRRCLRCTIWAAALRTASSWRCAAASMGLSMCLVGCWCRACVTAPLMVASLTRGLKPVRTPVAILGSLGMCIYVPASRHWLISYSPIHLT